MADEPDTSDTDETVSDSTATAVIAKADDVSDTEEDEGPSVDLPARPARRGPASVVWALVAGGVAVALLIGLTGWYGYRAYGGHEAKAQRDLFIATARQGAVNLTTINYTEIEADVQRILDSATGEFRTDFERRAAPFVEL